MAYLALYSSMVLRMMAKVDACVGQFAARLPKVNPAMAEAWRSPRRDVIIWLLSSFGTSERVLSTPP